MNEFDRFVRNEIKPLAYLRYGDDFIVFGDSEEAIKSIKDSATSWLKTNLCLTVHKTNNIILPVKQGLLFLGHCIYPGSSISVNKVMRHKIETDISSTNIASYTAMHLPKRYRKKLPWLIMNH